MPKRKPIRRIKPHERLPMHHAEVVGGDAEAAILETPGGDFKIQTREHEYPLDADEPDVHIEAENVFVIKKAQIQPEDIKRLSNLEDAGIRGGIHSKRTYLMALKDGSLWIWKQTGVEERDEIFVYELAKRMFRAIVPEVQPVFVPKLGWGSAMRKVSGVPAGRVDGLHGYFHGNEEMMADLTAMLVLDYMTGNPDRHSNNWFIMHNDRLAAIDNGWAGEDLTMSFADVFQPARLAGMMEDERLWPQLLAGITSLIQELSGKGDEVRALAEEIGIDKKEAVDMVRLWEPKLVSLVKLIHSEAGKVEKARVYIEPGTQPPLGVQVETGPLGGTYYESEDIPAGMEEVEPPPAEDFGPQVLTKKALTEAEMFNDGVFQPWVDDYSEARGDPSSVRSDLKNDIVLRVSEVTGMDYDKVNDYVKSWAASSSTHRRSVMMQQAAAEIFGLKMNPFIRDARPYYPDEAERLRDYIDASKVIKAMYDDTQAWLKEQGVKSLVLFRGMRWTEEEVPTEVARAGAGADVDFHANPLSSWSSDPSTATEFANMQAEGAETEPDWEDEGYQECLEEVKADARNHFFSLRTQQAGAAGEEKPYEEDLLQEFEDEYEGYDTGCEPPYLPTIQVRALAVAKVPADRIIALSCTGLGCLNEQEVVVAGGEQSVRMYSEAADVGGITADYFVEQEPEPEKPKTAQEQQEAQQHQWFDQAIRPLFAQGEQRQKALREQYELKIKALEDAGKSLTSPEVTTVQDEFHRLNRAIHDEMMATGKAMIEEAGYIPQGQWEIAGEIPEELAEWRRGNYSYWVEENLAPDAEKWVDKKNHIDNSYAKIEEKLRQMPPGEERHKKLIKLAENRSNAHMVNDKDYFRLGAKKIREAGYEPQGHFAERERLDAEAAGENKALRKARVYLKPGQEPPGGQQVEEGPRGGRYYESEGRGAAEEPTGARAMLPDKDAWWSMTELNSRYADAGMEFAEQRGRENPSAWKGSEVRGMLKEDLTKRIAEGTRIDETQVHHFIASWASSSSDDSAYSLSMQMAAARLFDLEPTSFVAHAWENASPEAHYRDLARPRDVKGINDPRWPEVAEKGKEYMMADATQILRHVYEQTQEWLRVRGIKKVTVGRGQGWKGDTLPDELRGLELTDEQFDRLYQTRLKQYNLREQEALGRVDEQNMSEERREALHEKIRRDFEKARKTLKVDLGDDPLSMIDLIRQDEVFYITQEWSKAIEDKFDELTRLAEGGFFDEDGLRAAKRKTASEIDAHFVEVRRKMRAGLNEIANWEGELDFHQNPLSSWSINHDTARMFSLMRAHGRHTAVTMWSEVPAERIISVPFTGPGCLTEHEFLVAGGEMPVHFRASAFTEGERGHDPEAMKRHLDPWEGLVKVRGQRPD